MSSGPQIQIPYIRQLIRNLTTNDIVRFKGLNIFTNQLAVDPSNALSLLNVIVSGDWGLHKMRIPQPLTPVVAGLAFGPSRFFDFQQAIGTRQILGWQATRVFFFDVKNNYQYTLIEDNPLNNDVWDWVTANNIAFAANGQRMMKWTGTAWQNWAPATPLVAPTWVANAGAVTLVTGRSWRYSYKNSVTGEESSMSPPSINTGARVTKQFALTPTASADPQVDTIVWYATLDGGGDYYLEAEVAVGTPYSDNLADTALQTNQRGQLINEPPLIGRYLAVWNGRVFVSGLASAPQDIIYSGYERIFRGRPEAAFPPFNRLKLAIGANAIAGHGVIQAGVVAFDISKKMYMFRGIVEDVTTSAPLLFSAYLEELPWNIGCYSHYTIASTPYGLVWLASDKSVQVFNGSERPVPISDAVIPLLRRITPGTERVVKGAYYNWLDRDWYVLSIAVDGSLQNNRLLFFDINPDQEKNAGVFISDIAADDVRVIEDMNGKRQLTISSGGRIYDCLLEGDTQGGITIKPTNTAGNMPAFWTGGWQGNDAPQSFKMYRYGYLIADTGGFELVCRYVNHQDHTIRNPLILTHPVAARDSRFTMNRKERIMSPTIVFPSIDASANVLQLLVGYVTTGDR